MTSTIPPVSLRGPLLWERVYDVLKELIIYRRIAPGSRINELELVDRLGVSRSPIREAIRALQQDGWLVVQGRQGIYVRTPDPEEARHLFETRRLVESQVVRLAAERITEAELRELDAIIDKGFDGARNRADEKYLFELNLELHRTIAAAARNSILSGLTRQLEELMLWYFSGSTRRGELSWQEHAELLEALRQHDPDKAAAVMYRHVQITGQAAVDSVEPQADARST